MPTVGGTEFPYTKVGIQKAKAWAEMTEEPLEMKEYKKGGQLDPSSLEEVAWKPIEHSQRQAVRYKVKTKGGEDRHIVRDIAGLTNEEWKRQLSTQGLREAIKNNPGFADTVSAKDAEEFMNIKETGLWDLIKNILPKFQEGGEVPAGRRMYGTNPRRKPVMQTSQQGMPLRGSEGLQLGSPLMYKKGGKVKMPKGWHV
jgi:hypothetical protein